jgi:hypothetical protein
VTFRGDINHCRWVGFEACIDTGVAGGILGSAITLLNIQFCRLNPVLAAVFRIPRYKIAVGERTQGATATRYPFAPLWQCFMAFINRGAPLKCWQVAAKLETLAQQGFRRLTRVRGANAN